MRHKTLLFDPLYCKALTKADAPGSFEAIGAVFGNRDKARDVLVSGALNDSLNAGLPVITYSHDWATPPIGATVEMAELDPAAVERLSGKRLPPEATGGLYGKGRLFVGDGEDVPLARHVNAALKAANGDGRPVLNQFSVGLNIVDAEEGVLDGEPVFFLKQCKVPEWGPCLLGMNEATFTISAKAEDITDAIKTGRLDPDELLAAVSALKADVNMDLLKQGRVKLGDVVKTHQRHMAADGGPSKADQQRLHDAMRSAHSMISQGMGVGMKADDPDALDARDELKDAPDEPKDAPDGTSAEKSEHSREARRAAIDLLLA